MPDPTTTVELVRKADRKGFLMRGAASAPEVIVLRTKLIEEILRKENEKPYGMHFVPGYEDEIFRLVNDKRLRAAPVNGQPDYQYVWVTGWFRIDYMGADPNNF